MLRILFRHFFLVIPILFFFWPSPAFAADPPNLISPSDNSTETKPKFSWEYNGECVEGGSCFRIEIDNNPDFSSPEKSTYTNNFSYSPQGLADGMYNWRVKAKDKQSLPGEPGKSDTWSGWSKVFKFTIGTQITSPPPAISVTQSSPTPQPSPSQKIQSDFSIKEIPSELNSNSDFETQISLTLPN